MEKQKTILIADLTGDNWKNRVNFIHEFEDQLDWDIISKQKMLSEDFIREFKDRVNWDIFHNIGNCLEILLLKLYKNS
jgi:hypothetical protein